MSRQTTEAFPAADFGGILPPPRRRPKPALFYANNPRPVGQRLFVWRTLAKRRETPERPRKRYAPNISKNRFLSARSHTNAFAGTAVFFESAFLIHMDCPAVFGICPQEYPSGFGNLQRVIAGFPGADSDDVLHIVYKDFAVADLPCVESRIRGGDHELRIDL